MVALVILVFSCGGTSVDEAIHDMGDADTAAYRSEPGSISGVVDTDPTYNRRQCQWDACEPPPGARDTRLINPVR